MHADDPRALIEATFRRIHAERMADMPLLNPALSVAAVGFDRHQDKEWRGILITPWSFGLMLLPATPDWTPIVEHTRVLREFASGTFVFLGNREEGVGEYLLCPLIHDMQQFSDLDAAVMTARASLIALDMAPGKAEVGEPQFTPNSRRRFLSLGE